MDESEYKTAFRDNYGELKAVLDELKLSPGQLEKVNQTKLEQLTK